MALLKLPSDRIHKKVSKCSRVIREQLDSLTTQTDIRSFMNLLDYQIRYYRKNYLK